MKYDVMIENAERILHVFRTSKSAPVTYKKLIEEFPEISGISEITFGQYIRVIDNFEKKYPIANKPIANDNDAVIQELSSQLAIATKKLNELATDAIKANEMIQELATANKELMEKLASVSQKESPRVSHETIANQKIAGWNITPFRGYYRAFRRINGKLYGLYLGKSLSDAEQKIIEKERQIRSSKPA